MSVSSSTSSNERGATALLVAMTMLLVMGVAAVVIDGGFGFSERRQAQAGVDFGALAALQAATSCNPGPCSIAAAVDNGADEAMTVVGENLPGRVLVWGPVGAPGACTDPNRPAEFAGNVSSLTECVSFTENLGKVRVVLPGDDVATTFGRILGVDALTVRAFAEAGTTLNVSSKILPLTPSAASGAELCLFSNQAPQTVPPCDGPSSGFFGYLDLALYGSGAAGTPSTCEQGSSNTRLAINITRGVDHNLVTYGIAPPDLIINDFDACPNVNEDVNQVEVQTGSPTGPITDGLIDGISGSINGQPFTPAQGRVVCDPVYSTECVDVRGISLDHTGLWEYLEPGTCPAGTDTHDEMLTCLNSGTARFTAAIGDHPRFAAVPVLWPDPYPPPESEAPDGPGAWEIREFVAVWIETLYFDCNASKCDTVHSPGEDFSPPGLPPGQAPSDCVPNFATTRNCGWAETSGPDRVEGMLAFAIDLDMLPTSITDFFPGTTGQRNYALTR